jgi:hypothetical protein
MQFAQFADRVKNHYFCARNRRDEANETEQIRPYLKNSVLCVTGGFRSIKAMEEAIAGKSTDMIGIARPVCAEPYLCQELIVSLHVLMHYAYVADNLLEIGGQNDGSQAKLFRPSCHDARRCPTDP